MVVCQAFVVEELNENSLIRNEGASYKRVCEALDRHSVIINFQSLVNIKFLLFDHLWVPRLFAKDPQSELTIIYKCYRVFLTGGILLNFF